jgi:dTDP-4-amino-4,6-dideoxygalactose transaminase
VPDWAKPVWHLFVIQPPNRDKFIIHLKKNNISTLIHYPIPPHLTTAYSELEFQMGDFPVTETISKSVLSLPLWPHMTQNSITTVINSVREYFY